jgi:hypothetical protein
MRTAEHCKVGQIGNSTRELKWPPLQKHWSDSLPEVNRNVILSCSREASHPATQPLLFPAQTVDQILQHDPSFPLLVLGWIFAGAKATWIRQGIHIRMNTAMNLWSHTCRDTLVQLATCCVSGRTALAPQPQKKKIPAFSYTTSISIEGSCSTESLLKSKSKLCYNRRSSGHSILVAAPIWEKKQTNKQTSVVNLGFLDRPIWDSWPNSYYCQMRVLCGALSLIKGGMSFVTAFVRLSH